MHHLKSHIEVAYRQVWVWVCGILLGGGVCALAEPRAQDAGPPQEPELRLVSEILPPLLADFVQRYGSDRYLVPEDYQSGQLEQELADSFTIGAIRLLRPRAYFLLDRPVTLGGPEATDPNLTADLQTEPLVVAAGIVELTDGTCIPSGERVPQGSRVEKGVLLNAGDLSVLVESEDYEGLLHPGEAAAVMPEGLLDEDPEGCAKSCSVTCTEGYYACCYGLFCAQCRCVLNGVPYECDAGGPGSTSCSIQVQ